LKTHSILDFRLKIADLDLGRKDKYWQVNDASGGADFRNTIKNPQS
jgi:hypothetical protein